MKKLFLASVFANMADQFVEFVGKSPQSLVVAFIPTAADQSTDPWYVQDDRAKLIEKGFVVKDISLSAVTREELTAKLQAVDIIFVAGGNTFYLLQEARCSGFVDLVPALVEEGKIYVGSSAGSYLACPTIEVANWKHQDRNKVGLEDLHALALVPWLLSAHYKPEYQENLEEGMRRTDLPVRILTDEQAFAVAGERVSLVGYGEEIKLK